MDAPELTRLLNTLVTELDDDEITGIVLGGSYARGEATQYSDIDLAPFLTNEAAPRKKHVFYRDGYLVSVSYKAVSAVLRDLTLPSRAIWVVNGFKGAWVLLDKEGSVGELMQEIEAFAWEPLQEAANEFAGQSLVYLAEGVHKVLGDLARGDELALTNSASSLLTWLTELMAVQRGVLIKSDRTYYRQVQEAVGLDSAWSRYHRISTGVEPSQHEGSPVAARGIAAVSLYRETFTLVRGVIARNYLETAHQTVQLIDHALQTSSSGL